MLKAGEKSELCRYIKDTSTEKCYLNNNFVNNSFASSGQIRARQDVPPVGCSNSNYFKMQKITGINRIDAHQLQFRDEVDRGRSKTRNYLDYSKYQEQMYFKNFKGDFFLLRIISKMVQKMIF